MTRRKSILGALLLCAVAVCAFGAANASATTLYVCEEVAKGTGKFTDSHCEKAGEGNFATVAAKEGEAKEVTPTQTTEFVVKVTIAGILTESHCEEWTGTGKATNELVGGVMQNVGTGLSLEAAKCVLTKPAGQECVLKGGKFVIPSATSLTETVGEVSKVKFTPTGKNFTEVIIEKCKTAGLNGTYPVEGTASGIINAANPAKLEFTSTSSALTLGGRPVTFTGTAHGVLKGTEQTVALESP
jgi:hypothetical protein